jgi:membrane protein
MKNIRAYTGIKRIAKKCAYLLKNAAKEFMKDNALKLSASLSFYTIFSLPALLLIIIYVFGLIFGNDVINRYLYNQINSLVGSNTATKLQGVIKDQLLSGNSVFINALGIIILVVGAIGVFAEIQSSINYIWGIKSKPRQSIGKFFKGRILSYLITGSVSLLLMVGLMLNTIMDVLNRHLVDNFSGVGVYVFYALNIAFVFIIIVALFTIIFKVLPDGKIALKDSIMGALISSTLFMLGKFILDTCLSNSHITTMYGVAGSLTLMLVGVYYSSIVLYFGVEFTKLHAQMRGSKIIPNEYSVKV